MFNIIYVIKKDDLLFIFSKEKQKILFERFYNKIFANLKFGCVVSQQVYKTINDRSEIWQIDLIEIWSDRSEIIIVNNATKV